MENREVNRAPWESLRLTHVGNVADVVRAGGGKLSPEAVDSGPEQMQKPAGQG